MLIAQSRRRNQTSHFAVGNRSIKKKEPNESLGLLLRQWLLNLSITPGLATTPIMDGVRSVGRLAQWVVSVHVIVIGSSL